MFKNMAGPVHVYIGSNVKFLFIRLQYHSQVNPLTWNGTWNSNQTHSEILIKLANFACIP